jgi:hypothetical protein
LTIVYQQYPIEYKGAPEPPSPVQLSDIYVHKKCRGETTHPDDEAFIQHEFEDEKNKSKKIRDTARDNYLKSVSKL